MTDSWPKATRVDAVARNPFWHIGSSFQIPVPEHVGDRFERRSSMLESCGERTEQHVSATDLARKPKAMRYTKLSPDRFRGFC